MDWRITAECSQMEHTMRTRLTDGMKAAMKSGEKRKLSTLRLILAYGRFHHRRAGTHIDG